MIIAIDGPQHSGKTTCLRSLRDRLGPDCGLHFVDEVAREAAGRFAVTRTEDWPALLDDPVRLGEFFDLEYDLLYDREIAPAVVDGSALLVTAYQRLLHTSDAVPKYPINYDLIFLCEPWHPPLSDGFRFLDGQVEVEREYRGLLEELNILDRVVELPANKDRLEHLLAHPIWTEVASNGS